MKNQAPESKPKLNFWKRTTFVIKFAVTKMTDKRKADREIQSRLRLAAKTQIPDWLTWFQDNYREADTSDIVVGDGAYAFSKGVPKIVFLRDRGEIHVCNIKREVQVITASNLIGAEVVKNVSTTLSTTTSGSNVLWGSVGVGSSKTTGNVQSTLHGVWLKLTVDNPQSPVIHVRLYNEEIADKWLAITKILMRDSSLNT